MINTEFSEWLKRVVKTILLSLPVILLVNLGIMALAVAGVINYNPDLADVQGGSDFSFSNSDISSLLVDSLYLILFFFPYILISYWGNMKQKLGFFSCLLISLICFYVTYLLTYNISGYLFNNNIYMNGELPNFWHYKTVEPDIFDAIIKLRFMMRFALGLVLAGIGGTAVPIYKYLKMVGKNA